jgi:hypothetical protein
MPIRDRIHKIDEALSFYKSLPTGTDEAHIHYAWCLSKLVANLNDSLKSYLDDLEKGQCKEVLGIDYQKMTCKDYWLRGGSLKKPLSISGQTLLNDFLNDVTFKKILTVDDIFNKLEEVVNELVDLLKEAKKKTMNAPKGLFSNFYSQQSEQNSEPVATAYEEWKMNVGCLTFERLKEKQMLTVADFLKNGILRCAPPPTQREICLVKLDLVKEYLPCDYQLPEDFMSLCAIFRRFISWQGDMLRLNYEVYGKYMFLYSHQLNDDEILELYRFDRTLMMIHEDMRKLTEEKQEGDIEERMGEGKGQKEAIKRAINIMWTEGVLQHKYDHTWIMMTMNETEWLPSFATPTEYLDYMEECDMKDRLPDRSTISKYYDKARGTFPNWTFTDAKEKEKTRRNNVGKRFLNLLQRA